MRNVFKTLLEPIHHLIDKKVGKDEIGRYMPEIKVPTKLSQLRQDDGHLLVTSEEKNAWWNKSDFGGSYNDLADRPWIPDYAQDILPENRMTPERIQYNSKSTPYSTEYHYCGKIDATIRTGDKVIIKIREWSSASLTKFGSEVINTVSSTIADRLYLSNGTYGYAISGSITFKYHNNVVMPFIFIDSAKQVWLYTRSTTFTETFDDVTYLKLGISELYVSGERYVVRDNLPKNMPAVDAAAVGQVVAVKAVDENGKPTEWEAADCMVVNSSTEGSTKKFRITVDDAGALSAVEVTE